MNWLDIVVIVLIAIPTVIGLGRGLIHAVLSLAGVIVGIILAGQFHAALAERLTFIAQLSIANVVAFAIIIIGVMIIALIIASVLKWIVTTVMLGWINRLGGAVFGFFLGAIFCSALLAIWVKFLGVEGAVADSVIAPLLLDRFPMILALLPGEFDGIRSFFQ